MNKKAYIQPTMAESTLSMEQLICASPGATPQVGGTTDQEEDLLSREVNLRGIWGDDEAGDEDF